MGGNLFTKTFLTVLISINAFQAFNYIDSDGDHVITCDVFCFEANKEILEKWLGPRDDWVEEFDSIDMTNKKGEGNVLFRITNFVS